MTKTLDLVIKARVNHKAVEAVLKVLDFEIISEKEAAELLQRCVELKMPGKEWERLE